jgi:hypothetical protein
MKRRYGLWLILAAVTIALVVFAPSDNDNKPAAPSARTAAAQRPSAKRLVVERLELERLDKAGAQPANTAKVGNAFGATSWYVPPPQPRSKPMPVVVAPPPVVVPMAPPLPFTYLGRYGETAGRIVVLTKGDRVYTVSVGDVIENTYRLEKLTPGIVHLMHLPTNTEQTLRTGETL